MAKAKSPIRLQEETMRAAEREGRLYHRTQAQQLEYWIKLGRKLAEVADPKDLLDITAGFASLSVQPRASGEVDPDDIFAELEQVESSDLADRMAEHSAVRYQASEQHPGLLERIDTGSGRTSLGYFLNGEFVPADGDGDGKRVADLGR